MTHGVRERGSRRARARSSLLAVGEPMLWLTGGALLVCAAMIAGLVTLVLIVGMRTFWPLPVLMVRTHDGKVYMGEVARTEWYRLDPAALDDLPQDARARVRAETAANGGKVRRRLVRTGNFQITQAHYEWVSDFMVKEESRPSWAVVMEKLEWGRFYGFPEGFAVLDPGEAATDEAVLRSAESARGPEAAWAAFLQRHDEARERWRARRRLERVDTGEVNRVQEESRLRLRAAEIRWRDVEARRGPGSREAEAARAAHALARQEHERIEAWGERSFAGIRSSIDEINAKNGRYRLIMATAGFGDMQPQRALIRLEDVVRAYPANRLDLRGKVALYLSRWHEFLAGDPREANSEGGVFPAIFGTVLMTMLMALMVVPFGVLAALYLREYAKAGYAVSAVRIAVNNLAGVPSIVFGVFGLGFFCYGVGGLIDGLFYAESLPSPTFGKGALVWASLTLALMTLPVVIVSTEEALAAVPGSMREGSTACGASKWQTIRRIVLPRAMPGIMTGMILAMARGAGEVAPLMLVGAVKLAPELPFALSPPFGINRSFMHLGFHIYDLGFQSQNSEAAKPMVFTTTLLLIAIVCILNLSAVWLRSRLRRRFVGGQF